MKRSLGEIWKLRRGTSPPASFPAKMGRLPNERPSSGPMVIPPRGRRDDRVVLQIAQLVRRLTTDWRRDLRVLTEERARKELAAVQTGAQDNVSVEERAGPSKERTRSSFVWRRLN
ncbi:MAG: hypothetical protein ACREIF_02565 [Chthoniobacterales bacterium]